MPLTLITTIGGATSNSYVEMTDAETYFDSQLGSAAWTASTADDKIRALMMAANRLNVENWLGSRTASTQRLVWPRIDVQKVDPLGVGYGHGWGYGYGLGFVDYYPSNVIPQQVKDAQCELALAYLGGLDEGQTGVLDSFSADGVSVKFRNQPPAGGLPKRVNQLIGSLTAGAVLRRA